jgi:thiamine-phosphate diphosphorylase
MRDPELSVRARLELGASLRQITRETGQYLSVRDRLDVALLIDSDGVHLAENSILPERVREVTKESWFISRAHHALELNPPAGVDAVLVSPVCAPRKNNPAIGIDGFGAFARRHPNVRCFALGGVDDAQASDCLRVGGAGIAAIGAVLATEDPRALLTALGIRRDAPAT